MLLTEEYEEFKCKFILLLETSNDYEKQLEIDSEEKGETIERLTEEKDRLN